MNIISILTYRTTGISSSFLKIPNWCFSNCIYTISYKRYTRYLTSIVHRQCLNSWCRIYLRASKNMLKFSISQTNNFITSVDGLLPALDTKSGQWLIKFSVGIKIQRSRLVESMNIMYKYHMHNTINCSIPQFIQRNHSI